MPVYSDLLYHLVTLDGIKSMAQVASLLHSYLFNKTFLLPMTCGVPQGSVPGPLRLSWNSSLHVKNDT